MEIITRWYDGDKSVLKWLMVMVHNSMNNFKSPGLYTLDGWITWDMNYILTKLLHFLLQVYRRYSSIVQCDDLFRRRKTLKWEIEMERTENINNFERN